MNSGKAAAKATSNALGTLLFRGLGKDSPAKLPLESAGGTQARVRDILAGLKLGFTRQNDFAVRALISEGLPLTLKLVQTVSRIQRKHPAEEAAAARIASRALAAGIDPESPEMDEVWLQILGSSTANDNGSGGSQQGNGQGSKSSQDRPSYQEGELATKLADLCIQAFKKPGMLNFYRPGPLNTAWIHVPFALNLDSVEFSGIFRILYNYCTGITECLAADIKTGAVRRLLCISGQGSSICLRYASTSQDECSALRVLMAREGLNVLVYASLGQLDEALMDMPLEMSAHV